MQNLKPLPVAHVILNYLLNDDLTKTIELGTLEKISKLAENKLFNREAMHQSLNQMNLSIISIINIQDALARCGVSLPSSAVILDYLSQHCMTENIEIEILEKIACAIENRPFNRDEIETFIKGMGLSLNFLKISDIGFTLQCCVQGEKPMISLMKAKKITYTTVEALAIPVHSPVIPLSKVTQELPVLPSSAVILDYLSQDCMTEDIEINILEKIACAIENRPFNRDEIEKFIKEMGLSLNFLKIRDIGYTLQKCVQGKQPTLSNAKRSQLRTQPAPITLRFPEMLERVGVRVGSFAQLCQSIRKQIQTNNFHANCKAVYSSDYLKYCTKEQYSYKNGMILVDHEPKRKIVTIKTVDIPKKVVKKLQDLMLECDLTIGRLSTYTSSRDEYVMRIKKELYSLTYYNIIIDSSMTISDEPESYTGHVIKWEKIQNLTLDEVRDLSWGNSYHNIYWETLNVKKMSEPFIREFSNKISWFNLAREQVTLSNKFKSEFKDKLNRY